MTFTEAEITTMKKNIIIILEYINTLKPFIREEIEIPIGPSKYGSYPYTLQISNRCVSASAGISHITFEESDIIKGRCYETEPDLMAFICDEWQTIKAKILKVVDIQKRIIQNINEFKL